MTQLRLVDPNGYTVPGTVTIVSPGAEQAVREQLAETAVEDAAKWTAAGFKTDARYYRIVPAA